MHEFETEHGAHSARSGPSANIGRDARNSARFALAMTALLSSCSASRNSPPVAASAPQIEVHALAPSRDAGYQLTRGLAAGADHACAVKDGRVFCWGDPDRRALGESVFVARSSQSGPPFWIRGLAGVAEIVAGRAFACARPVDPGAIVCWGSDPQTAARDYARGPLEALQRAQLDPAALAADMERTRLVTLEGWDDVVDLDAFESKLCGVHGDGTVSCMGFQGNRPAYRPHADATGRLAGVNDGVRVSVGSGHVCVVRRNGRVTCVGTHGTQETPESPPAREVPGLEGIVEIESGGEFTCALDRGGGVRCWGVVPPYAAGAAASTTPVAMRAMTAVRAIAAGSDHVCALLVDGLVSCQGSGFFGELGDDSTDDRADPVVVHGVTDATEITAGENFSCARSRDGSIACWGRAQVGQLGTREAVPESFVTTVDGVAGAVAIEAGGSHACAIGSDGRVACWGNDNRGQVGDGPGAWRSRRARPVAGVGDAVQLSLGRLMSCARTRGGDVHCWGTWLGGTLGPDFRTQEGESSDVPFQVPGIAGARSIAAGYGYGCAIVGSGVRCWGSNALGEVNGHPGPLVRAPVEAPRVVSPAGIAVQDRSALPTTWAVGANGMIVSWGAHAGRWNRSPVLMGRGVTDPSCGDERCCAVTPAHALACWDAAGASTPHPALGGVRSVRCAAESCCALAGAGIQCWGGMGLTERQRMSRFRAGSPDTPVTLPANEPVAVGVGTEFVCWAERAGPVRCWGTRTDHGQLGAVTADLRTTPVRVAAPIEVGRD